MRAGWPCPGTVRADSEVCPAGPEPGRAAQRPGASWSHHSDYPGRPPCPRPPARQPFLPRATQQVCPGSQRPGCGHRWGPLLWSAQCPGWGRVPCVSRHLPGPPLAVLPQMGMDGTLRPHRPGSGRRVSKAGQAPVSRRSVGAPPLARSRPSWPDSAWVSVPTPEVLCHRQDVLKHSTTTCLRLFHSVTASGGGRWQVCSLKGPAGASPGDPGPFPGGPPLSRLNPALVHPWRARRRLPRPSPKPPGLCPVRHSALTVE